MDNYNFHETLLQKLMALTNESEENLTGKIVRCPLPLNSPPNENPALMLRKKLSLSVRAKLSEGLGY